MTDTVKTLVELLRSPAMERILERAHDAATDAAPEYEASAADPRLVHREHYARQARWAREEIATIDALRDVLARVSVHFDTILETDPRIGSVWRERDNGPTWRVIRVEAGVVCVSGPGPCRGIMAVNREDFAGWKEVGTNG